MREGAGLKFFLATTLLFSGFPPRAHAATRTPERKYIFFNASRNPDEFRAFARIASQLKRYGQVEIDLGALADKCWYQIPPGGSPWHEYMSYHASICKFFPDPQLASFLPSDWVAKNRELLMAKAAILREFGLNAAFSSNDTEFLPEAFFERYPQLRGPRVDHPRRSTRPEFSPCMDLPETLAMIKRMTAELKRNVPEILDIFAHNNDAGAGLCWADYLYTGPNGPAYCRRRDMGDRVKGLLEAMEQGAEEGGGRVSIRLQGNFSQNELKSIQRTLPPDTYVGGSTWFSGLDPTIVGLGSQISETYPVLGILDPLSILDALDEARDPKIQVIVINTALNYRRADEPLETTQKLVSMVGNFLNSPSYGPTAHLQRLQSLAADWGGVQNADRLVKAFCEMHDAFRLQKELAPQFSPIYAGVTMRLITRPLVINPGLLAPEEESYFLPYVFNVSTSEARNDYIDLHGTRMFGPSFGELRSFRRRLQENLSRVLDAAKTFEEVKGAPEHQWLTRLSISLKMWVSVIRSIDNFYSAQLIRDRHGKELASPPRTPPKEESFSGDPDFILWTEIQRDEFDNTNELIELLHNGGLEIFARANTPRYEDTFMLGPDIVEALQKKSRIMQEHWMDVQKYLVPPNI
jgi:hypothetical protein